MHVNMTVCHYAYIRQITNLNYTKVQPDTCTSWEGNRALRVSYNLLYDINSNSESENSKSLDTENINFIDSFEPLVLVFDNHLTLYTILVR